LEKKVKITICRVKRRREGVDDGRLVSQLEETEDGREKGGRR
jgi:hypothetical protein